MLLALGVGCLCYSTYVSVQLASVNNHCSISQHRTAAVQRFAEIRLKDFAFFAIMLMLMHLCIVTLDVKVN